MLWLPAVPFQHAACCSYLFSLFYFIGREFILRYFNEKQYRNAEQYVNRENIGKCSKALCSSHKKSKPTNCVLQAFSLLKLCSGPHFTLVPDECTLRCCVILAHILRVWNLSLKFNIAVHNLPISPQPCLYKRQNCNRCVQRFSDSLPQAKLANDIHSDTEQYKWGTLNGLN